MVQTVSIFNDSTRKTDGYGKMEAKYHTLHEVIYLIADAVPVAVTLLSRLTKPQTHNMRSLIWKMDSSPSLPSCIHSVLHSCRVNNSMHLYLCFRATFILLSSGKIKTQMIFTVWIVYRTSYCFTSFIILCKSDQVSKK